MMVHRLAQMVPAELHGQLEAERAGLQAAAPSAMAAAAADRS